MKSKGQALAVIFNGISSDPSAFMKVWVADGTFLLSPLSVFPSCSINISNTVEQKDALTWPNAERGFVSVIEAVRVRENGERCFKISIHVRKCWSGKRCHALSTWPSHDQTERNKNPETADWDHGAREKKKKSYLAQINYHNWYHREKKGQGQVNKRC